jgi:hypothetical protein
MILKSLAMVLILTLGVNSFADEIPAIMQRDPGKVDCNDELKRCTYVVQNLTAKELIAKLNSNVFPGSFLSPSEGFIVVENLKKINFYINDEALRMKFISLIPLMDVFEDFVPSSLVELTTEIYSMSESASTEIQAKLTSSDTNPANDIADGVVTALAGGASAIGIKIGTNLLASILGSKKIKEQSSKISTVTQLIPNLAGINYSQSTTLYVSPKGSGVVKEQEAGLTFGGAVSISASDSDLVLIKDYSLKYGVIDPASVEGNERVNLLSISNPQLYLVKGTSSVLVSTVTTEERTRRELGAISFGKNKDKLQNQILIVTRAEAISFRSLIADLKKVRTLELHRQFTAEEKAKFPSNELTIEEVLSHVKPYSFFTVSGDRILGFMLDKNDARNTNINKNIEISVKNGSTFTKGSIDQKIILSVENLMLSGLKFDTLSPKDIDQSKVKIKLGLKVFNQSASVNKILYYNPETNKFIE